MPINYHSLLFYIEADSKWNKVNNRCCAWKKLDVNIDLKRSHLSSSQSLLAAHLVSEVCVWKKLLLLEYFSLSSSCFFFSFISVSFSRFLSLARSSPVAMCPLRLPPRTWKSERIQLVRHPALSLVSLSLWLRPPEHPSAIATWKVVPWYNITVKSIKTLPLTYHWNAFDSNWCLT